MKLLVRTGTNNINSTRYEDYGSIDIYFVQGKQFYSKPFLFYIDCLMKLILVIYLQSRASYILRMSYSLHTAFETIAYFNHCVTFSFLH